MTDKYLYIADQDKFLKVMKLKEGTNKYTKELKDKLDVPVIGCLINDPNIFVGLDKNGKVIKVHADKK